MNCDQVFDILTRGPFPRGENDDAVVEQHLAACHDCRRIAEALRPAMDLVHEALETDDRLPGYHGQLALRSERSVASAVMSAIASEPVGELNRRASHRSRRSIRGPWQLAAAAVIALSLSAAFWLADQHLPRHAARSPSISYQPNGRGMETLAAMNLPSICLNQLRSGEGAKSLTAINQQETLPSSTSDATNAFDCCTKCHSATSRDSRFHAVTLLASSCGVCHAD